MDLEKPGGTSGGLGTFAAGLALALAGTYFFVDAVRVTTYGSGLVSRGLGGSTGGGVVFLPLFVAVVALFIDAKKSWPWALGAVGIGLILVEVLSQLRFFFDQKLSHLLIMLVTVAAGLGLIIKSLREMPSVNDDVVR
jgi:hypothetical protein